MSSEESYQDRQNSELEVLKSIFVNELRDLRKSKQKKKWQPLHISITLTPQKSMSGPAEIYTKVDLHVTCNEKYPEEAPQICLENGEGLSNQQLATELSELEALARDSIGEVMIYELCQHVQRFLHEHNNKPRYSSFYEEMVSKQQERIKFEMQEKQMKEDKERRVLQDEISKRQEAFKEIQMHNRRELTRFSFDTDLNFLRSTTISSQERFRAFSRKRCVSTSESSEGSLCEHRGTKLLHFDNNKRERQVNRGKCLGHSKRGGSICYAGVDCISGELLAVTEWTLKCATSGHDNSDVNNLQNLIKQIAGIEQELNHLYKLQHMNLVHFLNMKYLQDKDNIIVYILQEFVFGTSCSYYLKENIPVDKDMLKHLAVGILSALQYLHENNVVHKDLRDTNVYIDRAGLVRLANYSLEKRLSDLYQACCLSKVEHDITSQGRSGKKGDIHKFGILLLSLAKGSIFTEDDLAGDTTCCNDLQPDLKDFILKCLVNDDRSRWSAEQLLQHCFIQTPLERGLPTPRLNGSKEQNCIEPEEEPDDSDIPFDLSAFGGQSRLKNEFEVLKWLGNGAFGDVLKVRNKLDGGLYALKRIKLNPKNKQLNKKMTREVKLLSRLNHENVVRYYNSWIESATLDDSTYNAFMPSATPSIKVTSTIKDRGVLSNDNVRHFNFGSENIEKLAPPMHEVEWNVSYNSRASVAADDSEEDNSDQCDDDSDSDIDWKYPAATKTCTDESDSIEFAESEKSQTSNSCSARDTPDGVRGPKAKKEIQFMYLQMEFCEKSTLRTAIDNGLYKDGERIWRLFREIVEGLSHIHQKGMIHRDLKPVNIFLDSNDHVKIGDFGLATTNILPSLPHSIEKESQVDKGLGSEKDYSESLTGQVGTALYVAPELSTQAVKAIYNQKVDIYSLGIIFFEMCYKPLKTGMERVKIILNIRSKEILLPPEFNETNTKHLLCWLLNHDPSQRPSANELLASEFLPPPQLEEAELQEMVRHTLSDAQSKAYKYLVSCCFSQQEATPAEDMTYDMPFSVKKIGLQKAPFTQEYVKTKVIKVFQRHGGQCIVTPLLMPKSGLSILPDSCVQLMTRTGSIVSIPYDLRAPFARYVAWNSIRKIRRYAIERVYRENKAHIGFHPRELYEGAFDIISPLVTLNAEAELIAIVWEIYNEFPELQNRSYTIRINHSLLLQAILMACGIEREKFQDIYSILRDARKLKPLQIETHLTSLCLTEQAMSMLFKLFDTEFSISALPDDLKFITRRKGEIAALAKQGLKDIETVISFAESLGVKWPVVVTPLFVLNIEQYSGIFFQITYENKKRKRISQDVIAAGGRYDKILSSFRQFLQRTGIMNHAEQFGVGISISLDKLVLAIGELSNEFIHENKVAIDVGVCCVDGEPQRNKKELGDIFRELWALNLKVDLIEFTVFEEIMEYCQENNINHVVMLKNGERGSLRILTWERDRFQERKINTKELSDYFRQTENTTTAILNRSDSKPNPNNDSSVSSNPSSEKIAINFILTDKEKLSAGSKRNYKNAMLAQMSPFFDWCGYKNPFELFGVSLDMSVIRLFSSYLELNEDEQDFQKSLQELIADSKLRASLKKYVIEICENLWGTVKAYAKEHKPRPIIILYSLCDSRYKRID
ncbi:eIF-2-alpha kinase GCN2 [Copidosoma floridanum]|uniref:eIF-2-alpha kinase GCN2 n=1 Tax=Copidosoma floridanum TaxID=29053 RepID=UPI000C6FA65D|nr:eIF-2-alpha kinase GCN2 [Copidosoma floridanum]